MFVIVASVSCALIPQKTDSDKKTQSKQTALSGSASSQDASALITDKNWLLSGFLAEPGFIQLEPEHGTEAFMFFNSDNTFYGTTGVNRFMGSWKPGKTKNTVMKELQLDHIGTTLMAAPNEVAAQFERDILHHLNETTSFKMSNDTLSIFNKKGEETLKFVFKKILYQKNKIIKKSGLHLIVNRFIYRYFFEVCLLLLFLKKASLSFTIKIGWPVASRQSLHKEPSGLT